jgi:lipoprotein Spr
LGKAISDLSTNLHEIRIKNSWKGGGVLQIALPIGTPLDKNLLSLGVFLLAGISVIPVTTPGTTPNREQGTKYYNLLMNNQEKHERDFFPLMLTLMREGILKESQMIANNNGTDSKDIKSVTLNESVMQSLTSTMPVTESTIQSITLNRGGQDKGVSERIVDSTKAWIGVPYLYGGVTVDGVDCSGLVQNVFKQNGIELPRTSQDQFRSGMGVPRSQLKPADLVFFSTSGSGASHVGIYIGDENFVSATREQVEIQSLKQEYWNSTYRGSRRVVP